MGRRRIFKNSQEFTARPESDQCSHVCRLCWPKGKGEGSQASASDTSQATKALAEASGNLGESLAAEQLGMPGIVPQFFMPTGAASPREWGLPFP